MSATIICPYVFEEEISALKEAYWELPFVFERDTHKIGSDLMFERMWNNCNTDIIIFHADMRHYEDDGETLWYEELCSYAEKYPEAGLLGMKLLYPAKNDAGHHWIESAGGRFDENGNPEHFGSGLDMNTQQFWKEPEQDAGQYDHVREYGLDFKERVEKIGFEIELIDYVKNFSSDIIEKYSLKKDDFIPIARKLVSN